jgi:hypothetical protein
MELKTNPHTKDLCNHFKKKKRDFTQSINPRREKQRSWEDRFRRTLNSAGDCDNKRWTRKERTDFDSESTDTDLENDN